MSRELSTKIKTKSVLLYSSDIDLIAWEIYRKCFRIFDNIQGGFCDTLLGVRELGDT